MPRRFRFSLRALLLLMTISAVLIVYWPRPAKPGSPNLVGNVSDSQGRPVAGVKIQLYGGFATRWPMQSTITDQRGDYVFKPLKSGGTLISEGSEFNTLMVGMQLEHPDYCSSDGKSWWDESVPTIQGHNHVRNFTVVPGGTLSGYVGHTQSKQPCVELDLRIMSPSASNSQYLRYVTTDDKGNFVATGLPAGQYVIDVNEPKVGYPELGTVWISAGVITEERLVFDSAMERGK